MTTSKLRRVLVVENSASCALLCEVILARAGYVVTVVSDVKNALSALRGESYDGLVCDLLLPDGNGCQIVRCLRQRGDKMFAVAVTGLIPTEWEEEARAAGFDEYLLKPFRPSELEGLFN